MTLPPSPTLTMANKLTCIPLDNTQNYPFCKLHLVVETFGHLINQLPMSPKLLNQQIIKRYYKTFGISVIKSLMSSPSLNRILDIIASDKIASDKNDLGQNSLMRFT